MSLAPLEESNVCEGYSKPKSTGVKVVGCFFYQMFVFERNGWTYDLLIVSESLEEVLGDTSSHSGEFFCFLFGLQI